MAAGEQAGSRSVEKVEEELRVSREKGDREQTRLERRVAELEKEVPTFVKTSNTKRPTKSRFAQSATTLEIIPARWNAKPPSLQNNPTR